jgi:hypothetical protein
MSDTELLLKKVEGLPPDVLIKVFELIDQLTCKPPPAKGGEPNFLNGVSLYKCLALKE